MALQKTFTRYGFTANYIRLSTISRIDYATREAVAWFSLSKDGTEAEPLVAEAFRLRLTGADFDTYLAKSVLATHDVNAQLYIAAKALSVASWAGQASLADAADA
jgi:hypothetical protein